MKKCKKSILLIFGYVMIAAVLFPPYKDQDISNLYNIWSDVYIPPEININKGFSFLPIAIFNHHINTDLLITELFFILALGGFSYIVFCVILNKEK